MAALGGKVILFGGLSGNYPASDTWAFDGSTWAEISDYYSAPPPRWTASMVTLGDELVLFGGWDINQDPLGDTWTFDGTTWTQVTTTPAPPARIAATMAVLP